MLVLRDEQSTSPVGSNRNRHSHVSDPLAFGGSGTWVRFVPSNSKAWQGWPAQPLLSAGPAMHRTRPLGNRTAGASNARQGLPAASVGKSGPAVQVPAPAGL